jgi:ribosome maturation factor RimP
MSRHTQGLQALVAPVVRDLGYELVGCELLSSGRSKKLCVYVDHPNGVGIDDCEKVSRQISSVFDVEDPVEGRYRLEVSSPGLDRPLFTVAHFEQQIGSTVKLKTYDAIDDRRNYVGLLEQVSDEQLTVNVEGQAFVLNMSNIMRANVVPDYDKL